MTLLMKTGINISRQVNSPECKGLLCTLPLPNALFCPNESHCSSQEAIILRRTIVIAVAHEINEVFGESVN